MYASIFDGNTSVHQIIHSNNVESLVIDDIAIRVWNKQGELSSLYGLRGKLEVEVKKNYSDTI